jgi:hypothetical protein
MAEDVLGIREIQVYLYRERDAAKVRLKSEVGRAPPRNPDVRVRVGQWNHAYTHIHLLLKSCFCSVSK